MKLTTVIGIGLLIVSITAGTTLVLSNGIDFSNIFRQEDDSNSNQQPENESILTVKSITYDRISNELNASIEIWTADGFSYFGNIHPFLMEIIDSDELIVINSQCFCSKDHEFPAGTSLHTTIGWIAYNTSPPELIDDMYILPDNLLESIFGGNQKPNDTGTLQHGTSGTQANGKEYVSQQNGANVSQANQETSTSN